MHIATFVRVWCGSGIVVVVVVARSLVYRDCWVTAWTGIALRVAALLETVMEDNEVEHR